MGFGHCQTAWVGATELTTREREVLRRIADGESTRQIAKGLAITPATARTHAHNLLLKLGARSRIQAIALAAPALVHPAPPPDRHLFTALTLREREVLACIVEGLTRAAIATRLCLSPHTVRTHARNILAKLGVHSTLQAAVLVRRVGVSPLRC